MELSGIRVAFYTEDEIRKLSVAKVTNAATYDRGVPRLEGLNDPRLGISHQTTRCPTCNEIHCDQHMGYVELARPVYRLGAINYVIQVLRCVCRTCAKPKYEDISAFATYSPKDKLRAVSDMCKTKYICQSCKSPQPTYARKDRTFIETSYREKDLLGCPPDQKAHIVAPFQPEEARAILEALSDTVKTDLNLLHPEEMVTRLQLIPPPCIRPSNFVGESKVRSENDLTVALQDLVKASIETSIDPRNYVKLQVMQAGLVNHTIKKTIGHKLGVVPSLVVSNKRKIVDLKTRLSGKKGRFRGNLSGKRVDQSGRSVVGPDSSHDITELGVPSTMMNTLTFPEKVTSLNINLLAKSILRGAYKNDGAMAVQQGSSLIWLPILDLDARQDLAAQLKPGDTVERHLKDGDWVIFNRQPSLWKASMMAFTIYRTNTLCFRLPLPVTKPFNADFDGDEMNIHSLQGYEAIAEAQELLSVPNQILNPQSNSVIVGLVQDSLVGGYLLSKQDTFLRPDRFSRLLLCRKYDPHDPYYNDMGHPSDELPNVVPAILKSPKGIFYTGKQAISVLLPNLSYEKKVRSESLFADDHIVIRNELLCGQLCKATLGASNQGILQAIHRSYGSWATCKFISDAQRMFVTYLSWSGPSISILDCVVTRPKDIIRQSLQKAERILDLDLPPEIIEAKSSSVLQETLRTVGASVVKDLSLQTGLSCVVTSGSKGNVMNIAQIAGCVGQQTVFGRRIPMRTTPFGKRTLAYFSPDDKSPISRGFIQNSYMTGLSPHEFFYHQMAGREGIVATAVNTADSGYNQRRMIKSQESQCIAYDGTVRVCGRFIVQESYGYDDLDGSKIIRTRFPKDILERARTCPHPVIQECVTLLSSFFAYKAMLIKELDTTVVCPVSADLFSGPQFQDYQEVKDALVGLHASLHHTRTWHTPIPVAVTLLYAFQNGSCDLAGLLKAYSEGLVQPGESVGALAATSIGEPSMQMTLNVFHYTGIASKNVTITGLPRFRQLINAVDTYETANMNVEVPYELAPKSIQSVTIGMVADISVTLLSDSLSDTFLKAIPVYPGALFQKLAKRKMDPVKCPYKVSIALRWNDAEQHQVSLSDLATGLRKAFGSEVAVLCGPDSGLLLDCCPIALSTSRQYAEAFAESLNSVQVTGIPGVKRSLLLQETRFAHDLSTRSMFCLDTEGSSLLEFCKLPHIHLHTAVTNNVLEVATIFGITAAVNVLQAELHKVLSFDSSYVDPRHTFLLADTMCRTGNVCAMNRHNMESLGNSILQRASFEQSLEIFHEGAVFGRTDNLAGATERIMVGQPANVGTGIVTLLAEVPKANQESYVPKLKDVHEDNVAIVRPLDAAPFSLEAYSLRVQEESRDMATVLYTDFFSRWRAYAGIHRYAAQVSLKQELPRSIFFKVKSEFYLGTWIKKSTRSYTQVDYAFQNRRLRTQISDTFARTHGLYDILETTGPFRLIISKATESLPLSIVPERVQVVHETSFYKTGFCVSLQEIWEGSSHTEAETKVLTTEPSRVLLLEFEDPEQMLQIRATNAQFVNAFLHRMIDIDHL